MSQKRLDGKTTLVDFVASWAASHTGPGGLFDWVYARAHMYDDCPPELLPDPEEWQRATFWKRAQAALRGLGIRGVAQRGAPAAARPVFGGTQMEMAYGDYIQSERVIYIGHLVDTKAQEHRAKVYATKHHLSYQKVLADIRAV